VGRSASKERSQCRGGAVQDAGHHLGVGEHAVGAERMEAGQAELASQFPTVWRSAWGGERSPESLEIGRGDEAIEFGLPEVYGFGSCHA